MSVSERIAVIVEWDTHGSHKDHEHVFMHMFDSLAKAEQFIDGARRLHAELKPATDIVGSLSVSMFS
ncbi:MAG: hypothetical protein K5859_03560 [Atopobiaceae bacterium]|nr:hypothetical protein [Atopobiaceae bacterium]